MKLTKTMNEKLIIKNQENIKSLFPKTWTHTSNLNLLKIGFNLKLIGIDFRSNEDFAHILGCIIDRGIIEIDFTHGWVRRKNTQLNLKPKEIKLSIPDIGQEEQ